MRTIAALIATLVIVGFVAPADAQMSANTRDRLATMRTQHPTTYASCHTLAIQRGYNAADQEVDGLALMHFISGCIMGQPR